MYSQLSVLWGTWLCAWHTLSQVQAQHQTEECQVPAGSLPAVLVWQHLGSQDTCATCEMKGSLWPQLGPLW